MLIQFGNKLNTKMYLPALKNRAESWMEASGIGVASLASLLTKLIPYE
jgi:hypothetical protein